MRRIPYFFGDATEVDFLCELPIDSAKMVISTLPRADDQMTLIKHIRLNNKETLLIANLSHSKFLENLYGAGADYIMMPHLLSGQWMANLLKTNNWDRKVFRDLTKKQKEELRLRFTLGELVEKK
ncbi:MAG: NAD-binding protein, partial [Patescibacteria group bacterium]|nr:NAD-binding protein [Patescibacteria group bacterium]